MTTKFDLKSAMDEANQEFGGSTSEWLELVDGATRVRLLTPLIPVGQHYTNNKYELCVGKDTGCPWCKAGERPSTKWLGWVLDRKDGNLKPASLPYTVASQLKALQENPEWSFDTAPMPYDITINRSQNGDKTEYSTLGSPKREPVSDETLKQLEEETPITEIKANMKSKQMKKLGFAEAVQPESPRGYTHPTEETEGIKASDIPF